MEVVAVAGTILYESGVSLEYPYRIDFAISNKIYYSQSNKFVENSFYSVIARLVEEPNAFYLAGEDMNYYSKQEIDAINKIKTYLNVMK